MQDEFKQSLKIQALVCVFLCKRIYIRTVEVFRNMLHLADLFYQIKTTSTERLIALQIV